MEKGGILTAFYDLEHGPVSFDFVTWLVRARKEAGDRRLHVVVVPKENGIGGFSRDWGGHDEASARWRLWHIVMPAAGLAGATICLAPTRKHAQLLRLPPFWWPEGKAHFMGPLVDAARRNEAIPLLRASDAARGYVGHYLRQFPKAPVTLTLRNQASDSARNTDYPAWMRLSRWLTDEGWPVVVLDDTHQALLEGRGYAELDLDLRLALYEQAAMNLIGNNGPQELLKFSAAPYRVFGVALSDGWKKHFRQHFHMEPGEQVPWADDNQRLVYEPDTFEVMQREFRAAMGGGK